jgi:hypothetical protein
VRRKRQKMPLTQRVTPQCRRQCRNLFCSQVNENETALRIAPLCLYATVYYLPARGPVRLAQFGTQGMRTPRIGASLHRISRGPNRFSHTIFPLASNIISFQSVSESKRASPFCSVLGKGGMMHVYFVKILNARTHALVKLLF